MNACFFNDTATTEIVPGLSVITTPGHTVGHQCVVVQSGGDGPDLLLGDAAYTPRMYAGPTDEDLVSGQAADPAAWRESLNRIKTAGAARVHFCHSTAVIHS